MKLILIILLFAYVPFSYITATDTSKAQSSIVAQLDSLKSNLLKSNIVSLAVEDTIVIEKKSTEIYGYRKGELLSYKDYKELFAENPDALSKVKAANTLHKVGNVFAYVGGYMFGFIGVMGLKDIDQVDYTWGIALGSSVAIVGVGLLFYLAGNNNQVKAINIYNKSINHHNKDEKIGCLKVGFTNSGVGLVYNF